MRLEDKRLYKDIAKTAIILTAAIFLCRVTKGYFSVVMAVLGVWWAFTSRFGLAIACYAFFPFLIVLDQGVLPKTSILAIMLRLSPLVIGLVLFIMATSRRGVNRLPFGSLFFYLILAIVSSMNGWAPMISYLKLTNFILFLIGIWLGTQNMQKRIVDTYVQRIFFLSIIVVIVFGSLLTIPFPSIGYSTSLNIARINTNEAALEALSGIKAAGGIALFSGILNHSQALAPVLTCCISFALADMLFVEERFTSFHLAIIGCGLIELYLTRSRTGLFSCFVGLAMILVYATKHMSFSIALKAKIKRMASFGIMLLIVLAIVCEISNRTFTRWIYKSNDSYSINDVAMSEALTGSRQQLINESIAEFKMNPIFGMGFQVNWGSQELFGDQGFVLSAPIEKGLLPVMIIGEGGIVGAIAFIIFLISFYSSCTQKRLWITIAMFTTFLATNIGEATFFSPGGIGGILWMMCVVGGFALDTFMLGNNLIASRAGQWCQPIE